MHMAKSPPRSRKLIAQCRPRDAIVGRARHAAFQGWRESRLNETDSSRRQGARHDPKAYAETLKAERRDRTLPLSPSNRNQFSRTRDDSL